jgi:hypothetical protein
VKTWCPAWTRICLDAAFRRGKCIIGRDIGMRGFAVGSVLGPLHLAMFWLVRKGLEPHSSLAVGGEWHLQEMQMAALLDMGLRCYNLTGWKACLACLLLFCVVLAWTEPMGHQCLLHTLTIAALHAALALLAQ